ncbi:hypothetical protein FB45DRAFT_1051709 [Roridomyces roridus]|uniref:Uncharacterized protein n=1 Tax=Roridomyces roridus TaxID=1738132 RepID=A0AAD7CH65_9AGAR|nr:hypothetical protein FB45DRAFT_1051709 [Roridomyces roridus]
MSNPRKRTHDERVPTLIYSATGHSRIAKLFTEDSLEQIKENVRKRFGLGSIADFTLLYETDIALVDDDDFAAFEAHAHSSAVPVNVIVNILPNAVVTETVSSTLVADSHVSGPPAKKRRVAAPPPQTESTPPVQKNPAPLAAETVPTATAKEPAPVVGAKRKKKKQGADPPPSTSANVEELPEQERPKKLKKATDKESATASKPAAEVEPDNREQEPPKKRTKKVTPATRSKPSTSAAEGGSTDPEPPEEQGGPKVTGKQPATAPKPSTSSAAEGVDDSQPEEPKKKVTGGRRASAVSSSAAGNATGEPQVDGGKPAKSKAKSKKDASDSAPPKSSKKSNVPVSEAAFTFPEELANVISVGGQAAEPESASVKPRARKTKAAGAEDKAKQRPKKKKADVDPEQPSAAADPAVAAYLKSLIDGIQTDSKPSDDKPSAKASVASAKASVGVDTLSCPFSLDPTLSRNGSPSWRMIQADRSELIQQLRKLDPKGSNGVNTSLALDDKRSSISSDDESDSPPLPPISYSVIDAELDAVINGPPSARLAAKDIVSEDEDEEEEQKPENIILENDDDDDIAFRRRSKKLGIREDSSDEEREGIPDAPDSPRSSATQPLVEIDIHQSQVPDFSGDKAVDDAMASDKVLFPTAVSVPEEDRD